MVLSVLPLAGTLSAFGHCRLKGGALLAGDTGCREQLGKEQQQKGCCHELLPLIPGLQNASQAPPELGCSALIVHCVHASNKPSARCWVRVWATTVPPHKPPTPGDKG